MKVRQLSVFLENRKGRLCEVCSLLGDNKINIRALTVAETETFGVLRIVVDNPDKAAQVLKDHKITANITNVVAVEVKDKPGGLAGILKVVADHDINVEYMYGFVEKSSENALMVFRFENPEQAAKVLAEHGIRAVGEQDIAGL